MRAPTMSCCSRGADNASEPRDPVVARASSGGGGSSGVSVGPGSLTWRYFGDRRLLFFIGRTGLLQGMHPGVSAVLEEHSVVFSNPWARIMGSIPDILGVIYDAPDQQTPRRVKGFHDLLSATDSQDRYWEAADPAVFGWTHVTFVELVIAINLYFGTPLTRSELEQLVAESVSWWDSYGLGVPPPVHGLESFDAYWKGMLAGVLERTETAEYTLRSPRVRVSAPPGVPRLLWLLIRYPAMTAYLRFSIALLPPEARTVLGVKSSAAEQMLLKVFGWVVRHGWPLLPERWRYHPRAHAGVLRERSQATEQQATYES